MDAGGPISYGASALGMFDQAIVYVDKILKGVSDSPVEEARQLDFIVNLKTAKALGLTIPQSLLLRADQVIDP